MSHDLRTPLNSIIGFSDVLRAEYFGPLSDPRYKEYANNIHDSGSLLLSLINDILDLSRVEAGKYELAEKPVNISSMIQISFRQLAQLAKASNQILSADVPPDTPAMRSDERALIQILNNLLSNAIKFTPHAGKIDVAVTVDEGGGIVITVSDTGTGISKGDIARVLKPFEQAHITSTAPQNGTGLGLYLCANLMNLFGGSMAIESELDKGTTVTIRFPPNARSNGRDGITPGLSDDRPGAHIRHFVRRTAEPFAIDGLVARTVQRCRLNRHLAVGHIQRPARHRDLAALRVVDLLHHAPGVKTASARSSLVLNTAPHGTRAPAIMAITSSLVCCVVHCVIASLTTSLWA